MDFKRTSISKKIGDFLKENLDSDKDKESLQNIIIIIFMAYNLITIVNTVISHFRPLFLFYNFFEHIFEHMNAPLSGLFWRTKKCRHEDLRGDAFSIRHYVINEWTLLDFSPF